MDVKEIPCIYNSRHKFKSELTEECCKHVKWKLKKYFAKIEKKFRVYKNEVN